MPNEDPEILAAVRRYVMPDRRYMKLHGWNIEHWNNDRRDEFGRSLSKAAIEATEAELIALLQADWRARLTAAWLIGMDLRTDFQDLIGDLLAQREGSNQLKGYVFALTRFGTHSDAEIMCSFLSDSLRPGTPVHAQSWALGALLYLDARLGSSYADRFLQTDLWASWSGRPAEPDEGRLIHALCSFAEAHGRRRTKPRPGDGRRIKLLFDRWQPHRLPAPWRIIQQESTRSQIDARLRSLTSSHQDPFIAEPLSIAECEECHAVLFNTAPAYGDWAIAHLEKAESGTLYPHLTFPTISAAEQHMGSHSH